MSNCRFYGHNGMFGVLIPNKGSNQCGLVVSAHVPCQMEVDGLPIDEDTCPLATLEKSGVHLEPDMAEHDSRFHMRMVEASRIPNTLNGHYVRLACGHKVMLFGRLELSNGVAFCRDCFEMYARPKG